MSERKNHDLNHDFTINSVCHSIRSMFIVIGIYNFDYLLKFELKLHHSDWRANIIRDFFKIDFPLLRALKIITGHVIYNPASTYKFRSKTTFMTPDVIEKAIVQYSPPKFSNS